MHIKIKPWMDLTEDDFFIIRSDKIITMTESNDHRLIEIYNNYIEESEEEGYGVQKPKRIKYQTI